MKILAIRGQNLASLAGQFTIDLEQGPLGQTRLYAITGPTGSGKSTLLDALCLALFDEVPRLTGSPRAVAIGRTGEDNRLTANDVRGLLRRGTGSGWAEVDFLGVDHHRYRSRWEVQRAKGRVGGRFQNQNLLLTDLTDNVNLGRTKTEVLTLIEERLGLSFEQFRRSVLLAQGDFAAFLKAPAKGRGELLERITGTEIYSRLSIAAHRRASQEEERLRSLERELAGTRLLSVEERQALANQQNAALSQRAQAQSDGITVQRALEWQATLRKLQTAETNAIDTLGAAEAACQLAAPRHRALQTTRRAQGLRLLLVEWDRIKSTVDQVIPALAEVRTQEIRLGETLAQAVRRCQQAVTALEEATQQRQAAVPMLTEARELDANLVIARAEVQRKRSEAENAGHHAQLAATALTEAQDHRTRCDTDRQVRSAWLADHQSLTELAKQWPRWEETLERYRQCLNATRLAQQNSRVAQQEQLALISRYQDEEERVTQANNAVTALRGTLADQEKVVAQYDFAALSTARSDLEQQQHRWEVLIGYAQSAQKNQEKLIAAQQGMALAVQEGDAARQESLLLATELTETRGRLEEAERTFSLANLAASKSVVALRAGLVHDQPCPVCGGVEHPWSQKAELADLAQELKSRVGVLQQAVEKLVRGHTRQQTLLQGAEQRQSTWLEQIASHQQALSQWEERWIIEQPTAPVPLSMGLLDPNLGDTLAHHRQIIANRLTQLAATEQAAHQARQDLDSTRHHWDKAQQAVYQAQQALQQLQHDSALAKDRHSNAEETARQALSDQAAILDILKPPLGGVTGWSYKLDTDPLAFISYCHTLVQEYQNQQNSLSTLEEMLASDRIREAEARSAAQAAGQQAIQTNQALTQAQELEQSLVQQRACCLYGESVTLVEQRLAQREQDSQQALRRAQASQTQAEVDRVTAQTRIIQKQEELVRHQQALAQAEEALQQAVTAQELDIPTLRRHLAVDEAVLAQEETALAALERVKGDAAVLLREHRQQRENHQGMMPPLGDETALPSLLDEALARQKDADTAFAKAQVDLSVDDNRRQVNESYLVEKERQQLIWEQWRRLKEVIGSADGSLFRTYAQGLTLERLLNYANHYLEDLTHRYQLIQVPETELELQVIDRDMGDEIRGVHSLSGGETFLLSLALALGLASLASQRTQVESLFIDEGFGSLDPDTLDTALAALDALQAQGRQVGVISHVPALVERIGAQVRVEAQGGGRSRVRIVSS